MLRLTTIFLAGCGAYVLVGTYMVLCLLNRCTLSSTDSYNMCDVMRTCAHIIGYHLKLIECAISTQTHNNINKYVCKYVCA
ncbi:hypothetical protein SELR_pSRC400650 (plasmid) [Selenomonas ruminantium subsp. lactilytica TAM6421]|uniref:Uncharacterized protein n=1 Tax=Selenomonas ruminantium subsp. lactilytica (strain NBRC 103574 / TAM6421) TaxID=927704 RepID=I0GVC9_SELRL|nr:hypothetical protein SELR_pSRC400650 [Selenomonas ruminantium subsp. lactilytica TAM6421]